MNKIFHRVKRYSLAMSCIAVQVICSNAMAESAESPAQLRKSLSGEGPTYEIIPIEFAHGASRIATMDFNGDDLQDLLVAHGNGLALYFNSGNSSAPYNAQKADIAIDLQSLGDSLGWVDIDNSIYAIRNNQEVVRWQWQDQQSSGSVLKETVLLDSLSAVLPRGVFALNFVADINDDGHPDLIIPEAAELAIHLGKGSNSWQSAFKVASQSQVDVRVRTGDNLNEMIGQSITIPQLNTRDVNADGRLDLIVESEQRLSIFLANAQGAYDSAESYGLDLTEVRERLGEVNFDEVDYNNLSSLLSYGFSFLLTDIDGDNIDDLLLREAGRVVVFAGAANGMDFKKPRQVLKSAGNVLGIMLRDEDGDGRLDLWLSRLEDISIGNIFMWMAISGSVDVEVFVYKNTGDQFARRPHRKLTVSYSFPSLFKSADLVVSAFAEQAEGEMAPSRQNKLAAGKAVLVMDGAGQDAQSLVQLVGNELWIYTHIEKVLQNQFLGVMNYSPKRDQYAVDLQAILESPTQGASDHRLLVVGKAPTARYPIGSEKPINDFAPIRLNNDDMQDFVLIVERDESLFSAELWMSR